MYARERDEDAKVEMRVCQRGARGSGGEGEDVRHRDVEGVESERSRESVRGAETERVPNKR